MPPADRLPGYLLASFIIIVIPGPGVLFVVGRALAHGRRTALATVCGNAAGNYLVAACVALGIGAVIARSAPVFTAVKLAGAAYLVWLGVQALRRRSELADALGAGGQPAAGGGVTALRQGFVVGVSNPKSYILFGAVLPQFVAPAAGHVPVQMLLLGLLSVLIGLVSDTAWGLAAAGVREWFARSPRRARLVGGAGGLAMIGVGVTVAVTGRSS
ncbi:MAG: LysE family translocator [Gemmatimonadota bacterium]